MGNERIAILAQDVVDRIAAGEVVQRPAAAIKELIENSLDATATELTIQIDTNVQNIIVADNGCGISKDDLSMAAIRHATSKLRTAEDLTSVQSFGFRGEALASISMVSRLSITSRTDFHPAAYKLSYLDGKPTTNAAVPTARTKGTTIHVQDLFYNMPNRRTMRASEEYNAILKIVQLYAIHYASNGVSFCCQKIGGKNPKIDLNTSSAIRNVKNNLLKLEAKNSSAVHSSSANKEVVVVEDNNDEILIKFNATKQVIGQVYGSDVVSHVIQFQSTLIRDDKEKQQRHYKNDDKIIGNNYNNNSNKGELVYECQGLVTSPSFQSGKGSSHFILFINNRYVDGCPAIKRSMENVYTEFTKIKPFVYVSLTIPPDQIDVNVHPTKREVALLYMDEICTHITGELRKHLSSQNQSFINGGRHTSSTTTVVATFINPYATTKKKRKQPEGKDKDNDADDDRGSIALTPSDNTQQKLPPNKLVRTNNSIPTGSIEPFLISTSQNVQQQSDFSQSQASSEADVRSTNHRLDCPLALNNSSSLSKIDWNVPGAFALLSAKCTCSSVLSQSDNRVCLPKQSFRKNNNSTIVFHPCSYQSIQSLRKRIRTQVDDTVQTKIRSAYYVGVLSHHRSLIQCGQELVMLNHSEYARELFYQLALKRFGSGDKASLQCSSNGNGIDIVTVISQFLQMEDMLQNPSTNEVFVTTSLLQKSRPTSSTNRVVAEQAAECLYQKMELLNEYFAIGISRKNNRIWLDSLPILLDGYEPAPYAVPVFLLRLATEVNWTEEKSCFYGICQELASFYAQLPPSSSSSSSSGGDEHSMLVRHTIFPAISALLSPSKDMTACDNFVVVSSLNGLYKVFERC